MPPTRITKAAVNKKDIHISLVAVKNTVNNINLLITGLPKIFSCD